MDSHEERKSMAWLWANDRDEYWRIWDAWRTLAKRRFHARPEDKGIPVPHTGVYGRRKSNNGAGVSANSRILSHHYADEGEKGKGHRREVKRKEHALWLREWHQEQQEEAEYGYAVEDYDWTDYDALTDPYDFYDVEDHECPVCNGPCEL